MQAIANKKQQAQRSVRRKRLKEGKSLTRRQLFVRRFFHRAEARVETLPPFFTMIASASIIGIFSTYGLVEGGHAKSMAVQATTAAGFDVHAVTISGHHYLQERDILDILGLAPDVSLITFDVTAAQETLLREPWVQSASVRKIYPDKLQVQLAERVPFATWQRGRVVSIIDQDGLVLDDFDEEAHGSLPILVGHGAHRQGAGFLALLEEFPTIKARVRAFLLRSERRWDILLDNSVTVKLPETGVSEALMRLIKLDEEKAILAKDIVSIDMRLPDRLVMRLSDEAMVNRRAVLERRKEASSKEKRI